MSESTWRCTNCDQEHTGIMDLGMASPSVWPHEDNSAIRLDGNFLSEDFCVIDGESFIVRGVLEIPVPGLDRPFGFGVWSSLSKDNFLKYLDDFDDSLENDGEPWTSWFCSNLGCFGETVGEKAWVTPRAGRQRPTITLMGHKSVLGRSQHRGIAATTVIEIFEYYGNHLPTQN